MADTTDEVADEVADTRPGWERVAPGRFRLETGDTTAYAYTYADDSVTLIRYVSAPCAGTLAERQELAERLTAEVNAAIAPVLARHGVQS